jgi:hypothetical protein
MPLALLPGSKEVEQMEAIMTKRDGGLPPAGRASNEDTAAFHAGDGVLLSVDDKAGRLVVTYGAQCRHVLTLHGQTRIVDETGRSIPPAGLKAGDEIRGECIVAGSWALATEIRVLRRATEPRGTAGEAPGL